MTDFDKLLKDLAAQSGKPMSKEQAEKIKSKYGTNYEQFLDDYSNLIQKPISAEQKQKVLNKYGLAGGTADNPLEAARKQMEQQAAQKKKESSTDALQQPTKPLSQSGEADNLLEKTKGKMEQQAATKPDATPISHKLLDPSLVPKKTNEAVFSLDRPDDKSMSLAIKQENDKKRIEVTPKPNGVMMGGLGKAVTAKDFEQIHNTPFPVISEYKTLVQKTTDFEDTGAYYSGASSERAAASGLSEGEFKQARDRIQQIEQDYPGLVKLDKEEIRVDIRTTKLAEDMGVGVATFLNGNHDVEALKTEYRKLLSGGVSTELPGFQTPDEKYRKREIEATLAYLEAKEEGDNAGMINSMNELSRVWLNNNNYQNFTNRKLPISEKGITLEKSRDIFNAIQAGIEAESALETTLAELGMPTPDQLMQGLQSFSATKEEEYKNLAANLQNAMQQGEVSEDEAKRILENHIGMTKDEMNRHFPMFSIQDDKIQIDGNSDYANQLNSLYLDLYEKAYEGNTEITSVTGSANYILKQGIAGSMWGRLGSLLTGDILFDMSNYDATMLEQTAGSLISIATEMPLFNIGGLMGRAAGKALVGGLSKLPMTSRYFVSRSIANAAPQIERVMIQSGVTPTAANEAVKNAMLNTLKRKGAADLVVTASTSGGALGLYGGINDILTQKELSLDDYNIWHTINHAGIEGTLGLTLGVMNFGVGALSNKILRGVKAPATKVSIANRSINLPKSLQTTPARFATTTGLTSAAFVGEVLIFSAVGASMRGEEATWQGCLEMAVFLGGLKAQNKIFAVPKLYESERYTKNKAAKKEFEISFSDYERQLLDKKGFGKTDKEIMNTLLMDRRKVIDVLMDENISLTAKNKALWVATGKAFTTSNIPDKYRIEAKGDKFIIETLNERGEILDGQTFNNKASAEKALPEIERQLDIRKQARIYNNLDPVGKLKMDVELNKNDIEIGDISNILQALPRERTKEQQAKLDKYIEIGERVVKERLAEVKVEVDKLAEEYSFLIDEGQRLRDNWSEEKNMKRMEEIIEKTSKIGEKLKSEYGIDIGIAEYTRFKELMKAYVEVTKEMITEISGEKFDKLREKYDWDKDPVGENYEVRIIKEAKTKIVDGERVVFEKGKIEFVEKPKIEVEAETVETKVKDVSEQPTKAKPVKEKTKDISKKEFEKGMEEVGDVAKLWKEKTGEKVEKVEKPKDKEPVKEPVKELVKEKVTETKDEITTLDDSGNVISIQPKTSKGYEKAMREIGGMDRLQARVEAIMFDAFAKREAQRTGKKVQDVYDRYEITKEGEHIKELESQMERTRDAVSEGDKSNTVQLFQVSEKAKKEYETRLRKNRPDLKDKDIDEIIKEVGEFSDKHDKAGNKKMEKLAFHWILEGKLKLPEDAEIMLQAEKIATIKKIDPFSFKNPNEIIERNAGVIKERINPDNMKSFTNKKEGREGIVIYDVEDSHKGMADARKIIDSHYGEKSNPWCILFKGEDGKLTSGAIRHWHDTYSGKKKIVFHNGRLVAFYAGGKYWNRANTGSDHIPIIKKMPNDRLKRSMEVEVNAETGKEGDIIKIFKGDPNAKNGKYEEWHKNGQKILEENHKDGRLHGVCKTWHENGQRWSEENYKDGKRHGIQKGWYKDGQQKFEVNYKDGKSFGRKGWYENGQLTYEDSIRDGKQHGTQKEWYDSGQQRSEGNYKDGVKHGVFKKWYENGQRLFEENYKDGKIHGVEKIWSRSGQLMLEVNYKNGEKHGIEKEWFPTGQLMRETNYGNVSLTQKTPKGVKGYVNIKSTPDGKAIEKVLTVLLKPDASTPIHENISHPFLEARALEAKAGDKDSGRIVNDVLDSYNQAKNRKAKNVTRGVHEYFAKELERYIENGMKASNSKLQKVFDKLRDWFKDIFKSAEAHEVDPRMEKIFKDMFGDKYFKEVQAEIAKEKVTEAKETVKPKAEKPVEKKIVETKKDEATERKELLKELEVQTSELVSEREAKTKLKQGKRIFYKDKDGKKHYLETEADITKAAQPRDKILEAERNIEKLSIDSLRQMAAQSRELRRIREEADKEPSVKQFKQKMDEMSDHAEKNPANTRVARELYKDVYTQARDGIIQVFEKEAQMAGKTYEEYVADLASRHKKSKVPHTVFKYWLDSVLNLDTRQVALSKRMVDKALKEVLFGTKKGTEMADILDFWQQVKNTGKDVTNIAKVKALSKEVAEALTKRDKDYIQTAQDKTKEIIKLYKQFLKNANPQRFYKREMNKLLTRLGRAIDPKLLERAYKGKLIRDMDTYDKIDALYKDNYEKGDRAVEKAISKELGLGKIKTLEAEIAETKDKINSRVQTEKGLPEKLAKLEKRLQEVKDANIGEGGLGEARKYYAEYKKMQRNQERIDILLQDIEDIASDIKGKQVLSMLYNQHKAVAKRARGTTGFYLGFDPNSAAYRAIASQLGSTTPKFFLNDKWRQSKGYDVLTPGEKLMYMEYLDYLSKGAKGKLPTDNLREMTDFINRTMKENAQEAKTKADLADMLYDTHLYKDVKDIVADNEGKKAEEIASEIANRFNYTQNEASIIYDLYKNMETKQKRKENVKEAILESEDRAARYVDKIKREHKDREAQVKKMKEDYKFTDEQIETLFDMNKEVRTEKIADIKQRLNEVYDGEVFWDKTMNNAEKSEIAFLKKFSDADLWDRLDMTELSKFDRWLDKMPQGAREYGISTAMLNTRAIYESTIPKESINLSHTGKGEGIKNPMEFLRYYSNLSMRRFGQIFNAEWHQNIQENTQGRLAAAETKRTSDIDDAGMVSVKGKDKKYTLAKVEDRAAKEFGRLRKANKWKKIGGDHFASSRMMSMYMMEAEALANGTHRMFDTTDPKTGRVEKGLLSALKEARHEVPGLRRLQTGEMEALENIANYLPKKDGHIDMNALYKMLTKSQKDIVKHMENYYIDNYHKLEYVQGGLRGKHLGFYSNYTPHRVLTDTSAADAVSLSEMRNVGLKSTTQAGATKDRIARAAQPVDLDAIRVFRSYVREINTDFHLTPVVEYMDKYFKHTRERAKNQDTKDMLDGLRNTFELIIENNIKTEAVTSETGKLTLDWIEAHAYTSMLTSIRRVPAEFVSNAMPILIARPLEFSSGMKYSMGLRSLYGNVEAKRLMKEIMDSSEQSERGWGLHHEIKVTMETGDGTRSKFSRGLAERIADFMMTNPLSKAKFITSKLIVGSADRPYVVPLWMGTFTKDFEKRTGKVFDILEYRDNPKYKYDNIEAMQKASYKADLFTSEMLNSMNKYGTIFRVASMSPSERNNVFNKANYLLYSFGKNEWDTMMTFGKSAVNLNDARLRYDSTALQGAAGVTGILGRQLVYRKMMVLGNIAIAKGIASAMGGYDDRWDKFWERYTRENYKEGLADDVKNAVAELTFMSQPLYKRLFMEAAAHLGNMYLIDTSRRLDPYMSRDGIVYEPFTSFSRTAAISSFVFGAPGQYAKLLLNLNSEITKAQRNGEINAQTAIAVSHLVADLFIPVSSDAINTLRTVARVQEFRASEAIHKGMEFKDFLVEKEKRIRAERENAQGEEKKNLILFEKNYDLEKANWKSTMFKEFAYTRIYNTEAVKTGNKYGYKINADDNLLDFMYKSEYLGATIPRKRKPETKAKYLVEEYNKFLRDGVLNKLPTDSKVLQQRSDEYFDAIKKYYHAGAAIQSIEGEKLGVYAVLDASKDHPYGKLKSYQGNKPQGREEKIEISLPITKDVLDEFNKQLKKYMMENNIKGIKTPFN